VAHKISHARKDTTLFKYFFQNIQDNPNLRYGRENEPKALQKYSEVTGNKIHKSGLVIKVDQPWLYATPGTVF
jgi:hypothetical protein